MTHMRQRLTAHGSATGDEIWDRYVHPGRWAEWSPQIRRISYDFDAIRPDTSGTVFGPIGMPVRFTILSVDVKARAWRWQVALGPIRLVLDHAVAEDETELVIDGPAPIVLGYLPLAQLALQRLVRG